MEPHILNKLEEKFWAGECTASEEQHLKVAFSEGKIPESRTALRQYLRFLENEKKTSVLDDAFDDDVLRQIQSPSRSRNARFFLRIAAAIVLAAGLSWFVFHQYTEPGSQPQSEFVDTFADAETAYAEVKKAMMMVSSEMNYGMEQTGKLSTFSKVKEDLAIGN